MPHLKYRDAEGRHLTVQLKGNDLTIGRQPDCGVVFPKRFVSRRHARLFPRDGRWVIVDLDSSHGTFVNRVRVTEKELANGDQILVGDELLFFADGDVFASKASAPDSPKGDFADPPEITAGQPLPSSQEQIIAETPLESGDLMRTILGARAVDVQEISESPGRSVAQLARIRINPLPPIVEKALSRHQPAPERGDTGAARTDAEVAGHLLALVKISDDLRRSTNLEGVCRTATEMALRATGATRGVLALRDGNSEDFVPKVQLDGVGKRGPAGALRISRSFVQKVVERKVAAIARNTDLDVALAGRDSIVAAGIRSILCAPLWESSSPVPGDTDRALRAGRGSAPDPDRAGRGSTPDPGTIVGYLYLDITGGGRQFRNADLDLVTAIGHLAASEMARLRLVAQIRAEEDRRRELGRFLSVDVIRHIEQEAREGARDGKSGPTLSAKEQEVTVMFADIVGFTTLAERMKPADVKKFLDDYLDHMTEVIVDKHGGTLDKYIGDAIMAIFGAPYSKGISEDAVRAVGAAVAMRDTVAVLRKTRLEYADVRIRIGINTGRVVAGMMGSQRRLEYSVIGDAVNVASRLEKIGEAGKILIGEATYDALRGDFECEFAGDKPLRNREKTVRCWWVKGPKV